MRKKREEKIQISEELAAKIERVHYLYQCRKQILDTILRNEKNLYDRQMLDYYQEKYEESYIEMQQLIQFIKEAFLSHVEAYVVSFYVEMSTSTLILRYCEKSSGEREGRGSGR